MLKTLKNIEKFITHNQVFRLLAYLFTTIMGVVVIVTHNGIYAIILVFMLGFLALIEGIRSNGFWYSQSLIFPSKARRVVSIIFRIAYIVIGVYLMILMLLVAF